MIFGFIFGFFLCMFVMSAILIKDEKKHDHKYCQKCVCEKSCSCVADKDKCGNKCLCD